MSIYATDFSKIVELFENDNSESAVNMLKKIQEDYLKLYNENKELKAQLKEVAEILDLAECMHYDGQKYWICEDGDETGPYCQSCYDNDGVLVRLQERNEHWECYGCEKVFLKQKTKGKNKLNAPIRLIK